MSTPLSMLSRGQLIRLELISDNVHHFINARCLGLREGQGLLVGRLLPQPVISLGDRLKAHVRIGEQNLCFDVNVAEKRSSEQEILLLRVPGDLSDSNMRRNRRVNVKTESMSINLVDSSDDFSVAVADISRDGARLVAPKRLGNIDDKFTIDMRIPYSGIVVNLPCVVRYVRSEVSVQGTKGHAVNHHHGVRFDQLSDLAQGFIDDVIAQRVPSLDRHLY